MKTEIKVKWEKNMLYACEVISFRQDWTQYHNRIDMKFTVDKKPYSYEWNSTSTQGLSSVFELFGKKIDDPIIEDIARQLSVLFRTKH